MNDLNELRQTLSSLRHQLRTARKDWERAEVIRQIQSLSAHIRKLQAARS
jgi:hypothetical protein